MSIGIYALLINGAMYVGQSINLEKRIIAHKSDLRNNRHNNRKLQNYFNKYKNIETKILKLVDVQKFKIELNRVQLKRILNVLEQTYINVLNPELNLNLDVVNPPKTIWTKENRLKASMRNKGRKLSPETILLMSKPYYLVSPEGVVYEGFNLQQFALSRNILPSSLNRVILGQRKQYKGWTKSLENYHLLKNKMLYPKKEYPAVTLFNPYLGEIKVKNLGVWCKENSLYLQEITRVLKGKREQSHFYFKDYQSFIKYQNKRYSIFRGVSYNKNKNTWIACNPKPSLDTGIQKFTATDTELKAAELRLLMEQILVN